MGKFTPFRTKNPAIDEYWPGVADTLPRAVMFGYAWSGSNVIGFFVNGRCWFGVEWRWFDEPSFSVIVNNIGYGFWWPDEAVS